MSTEHNIGTLRPDDLIYVAGHRGLVGSAIIRQLKALGHTRILTRSHAELDLCNQRMVQDFLQQHRPNYVILAAAKVGGIHANNSYPAEFIYQNLLIEANVIHSTHLAGVKRLLFLGSSCIYPRLAPQPIPEDALLTGPLEPSNEAYAIAKIAGIKLCESYNRQYGTHYRSVMPTNLYGPGDNFDLQNSHVIPALMRRFHDAKQAGDATVTVWGSGTPRREFLYVDDMANACIFVMSLADSDYEAATQTMVSHLNVGSGTDVTIRELAETIKEVVGFPGKQRFDTNKPDGTPRKLLEVSKLQRLGWSAKTGLHDGLQQTYQWLLEH
jgi:GDP-L-fucose synthase